MPLSFAEPTPWTVGQPLTPVPDNGSGYVAGGTNIAILSTRTVVSSRIGEFFYKSSRGPATVGTMEVYGRTITNGAITYPVWASMYAEFVSGNNIVFPADVNGMFIRNLNGSAGGEGVYQADATQRVRGRFKVAGVNGGIDSQIGAFRINAYGVGGGRTYPQPSALVSAGVSYGQYDNALVARTTNEDRPKNRAYRLFTIVDTYNG